MKRIVILVALLCFALGAVAVAQRAVIHPDGKRRQRVRQTPRPAPTPTPPMTVTSVNAVNVPHTFTVHVEESVQGNQGYRPIENAAVTITLTNSGGAVANPAGPFTGVTNADGQFSCTFSSATAGVITAHGVASITVPGSPLPLTVETDGIDPNGDDAAKLYTDIRARIFFVAPPARRRKGAQ
jgi:hypothetical protein